MSNRDKQLKHMFAPIPGRALADVRLSALLFRVLGAISARHRMGRNGHWCFENPKRIAERIGCNISTYYTAVSQLEKLGYLEVRVRKSDRRKREYRVLYDASLDGLAMGAVTFEEVNRIARDSRKKPIRDGDKPSTQKIPIYSNKTVGCSSSDTNRIYSMKQEYNKKDHLSTKAPDEAARVHNKLARMFGWERLVEMPDEVRAKLEAQYLNGELTSDVVDEEDGDSSIK